MRLSVEIVCVFAALTAHAFDSAEWLAQRGLLGYEARRLAKAYPKFHKAATEPADSIVVPLESHPNGSIKTSISANKAQLFLIEGFVWAEGVSIRQFRPDGSIEARLDADNCIVDRSTRSGWIPGHTHAEFRGDVSLDADKVYFSAEEQYLRTFTNTVLRADGRELRSVRADYDNLNGVAMFDGGVELRGTEGKNEYVLTAMRAFAFLSGTNDLKRVVALNGVRVKSGVREGSCDRAVYTKDDSKIVMYGDEKGTPAMLADNSKRRSKIEGARITFWLDNEQVEVVDSAVTIDANGIKLPKGAN
jgi:hypothetical protein